MKQSHESKEDHNEFDNLSSSLLLRRAHPRLNEHELLHLKESLDWYFEFALRIYGRLHRTQHLDETHFDDSP